MRTSPADAVATKHSEKRSTIRSSEVAMERYSKSIMSPALGIEHAARTRYAGSMIEIRPASADDAPAMARVLVDTWFSAHEGQVSDEAFRKRRDEWGYVESEQGWRRAIREAHEVSAQILVATDDNAVVAVGAAEVTEANCVEVGALYVDVRHQRSGIGRRLLEAAMDHYRTLGVATLHIAVLATNEPARRFYEHLGGRSSGTRHHPEGQEMIYAWDLSDGPRTDA